MLKISIVIGIGMLLEVMNCLLQHTATFIAWGQKRGERQYKGTVHQKWWDKTSTIKPPFLHSSVPPPFLLPSLFLLLPFSPPLFSCTKANLTSYLTQGLNCKTLCDEYGFHSLNASNMQCANKHLRKYGCGSSVPSPSCPPSKQVHIYNVCTHNTHNTHTHNTHHTHTHTHHTHSQSVKILKNSFETSRKHFQSLDLQPTKQWRSRLAKTKARKWQNDGGIFPKIAFGCFGQVSIPMWSFLRVFSTNSFAKNVHTSKHADVQQICVGFVCKQKKTQNY